MLRAALALSLLAAPAAWACSCNAGARAVAPAAGATGVPLNAEVKILWFGGDAPLSLILDGGVVPGALTHGTEDIDYLRFRPASPLLPDTQYDIVIESAVLATFRTGSTNDTIAPTFGAASVGSKVNEGGGIFAPASSCGTSSGYQVNVDAATDDLSPSPELFYNVYAGDSASTIDFSRPRVAIREGRQFLGHSQCNPTLEPRAETSWVVLTAVDRAGNESERSAPLHLGCGCGSSEGAVAALLFLSLSPVSRNRTGRFLSVSDATHVGL